MRREILQHVAIAYAMAAYGGYENVYSMLFNEHGRNIQLTDFSIFPSDKQKLLSKELHEFTIKGVKIMATSKKDAIKKYNHRKK